MPSRCCEFVDSRLRRSPPDRASAVPYGQAGENAMRFPRLAHRSAAAHKLHSTPQQHGMNLISGNAETTSRLPAFSLFLPGSCPNNRDRRRCESSGCGRSGQSGTPELCASSSANWSWLGCGGSFRSLEQHPFVRSEMTIPSSRPAYRQSAARSGSQGCRRECGGTGGAGAQRP